jgi:hypothetical protein
MIVSMARAASWGALLAASLLAASCRPGDLVRRGDGASPPSDGAAPGEAGARPDGRPAVDGPLRDRPAREGGDALDSTAPPPPAVWQPKPGTTWQWQLTGTLDTSVDVQMYDIDLFDSSAATIAALRAKGRVVICYLSAGSLEDWRSDAKSFPAAAIGNSYSGWPGEKWLDIRNQEVRALLGKRLDLAKSKGCDGVEPDNVDGYANATGFPLTKADQIDFNSFLAAAAHQRGLSVGLKNDNAQVVQLLPLFDWALTEECVKNSDCSDFSPFIQAGKAVFHAEYAPATKASVCPKTAPLKLSTLIKKKELDAWYEACP